MIMLLCVSGTCVSAIIINYPYLWSPQQSSADVENTPTDQDVGGTTVPTAA